jgi:hypothetical protein
MAELTLQVVPTAEVSSRTRRPVRRRVEKRVTVPQPKPLGLQIVALVLLVAVTAVLALLLNNDPSTVASAFIGAGLVMCVFAIVVWVASVLNLGIGPAQLLALIAAIARAIKESNSKKETETPSAAGEGGTGPGGSLAT